MKKKISKFIFMFIIPVVACLTLGIFLAGGLVSGYASALAQDGGSAYVGTGSTMSVGDGTAISDFSAVNGGGVYVTSGGTLSMSGGTIAGNTATSGSGHNVYNAGTFTMSGGTIGKSGNAKTYGIYNTGTMDISGGTVHDDIYSSTTFTTTPNATLNGTISLDDSASIKVENYAGTTPTYNISISSSRMNGTILTFQGSGTKPDLTKLNVTGLNMVSKEIRVEAGSSSTEWNVVLAQKSVTVSFNPQGVDENNLYGIDGTFESYDEGAILSGFASQLGNGGSYAVSTEKAFSGTKSLKIVGGSGGNNGSRIYRTYSGKEGKSYIFEAMVYSESEKSYFLGFELYGGNYNYHGFISPYTKAGSWQRVVAETPVLTSDATLYLFFYVDEGVTTYVDQVSVRTADSLDGGLLKEVETGETYSSLPTPTKTGYTFGGWFTAESGGTQVTAETVVSATASHNIYAHWTPKVFSVTLNNQNATSAGTIMIYEKYATGWFSDYSATTSITTITIPTKRGYTFGGYFTSTDGNGIEVVDASGAIVSSNSIFKEYSTVYAKWEWEGNYVSFPLNWDTEVASTDYMTTTVDLITLTSITFESSVPSGYTQIGTLSTGLNVYQNSSDETKIAFVDESLILAPENSSYLFAEVAYYDPDIKKFFDNLGSLSEIIFNNFDTSQTTTMNHMFAYLEKIQSLNLSNFNTENVTDMTYMFSGCSSLNNITFGVNFTTDKVTSMKGMFCSNGNLENINLSNFNTENVTDMSEMFYECTSLKSLDLSGFNTSKVEDFHKFVHECYVIETIEIGNQFKTSSATNMNDMFSCNPKLISLDLSSFDMTNVIYSGDMLCFGSDANLKYLETPKNNTSEISIVNGSPLCDKYSKEEISSVPANSSGSLSLIARFTLTLNADGGTCSTDSVYAYYGNEIASLPIPAKTGCSFVGWFNGDSRIEFPLNVTEDMDLDARWLDMWDESVGLVEFPTDWKEPFDSISELYSIEYIMFAFGDFSTDTYDDRGSVGEVEYVIVNSNELVFFSDAIIVAPQDCTELFANLDVKGIVFRNFDTYFSTNFTRMFAGSAIEYVDCYSFSTPQVTTMDQMFIGCGNLVGVYNADFDCYNLESCVSMFEGCGNFTGKMATFDYDESLELNYNLPVSGLPNMRDSYKLKNMANMFRSSGIVYFSMPYLHTENVTCAHGMFFECSNLDTLDLSNFILRNCSAFNTDYKDHFYYDEGDYVISGAPNGDGTLVDGYSPISVLYTPRFSSLEQFREICSGSDANGHYISDYIDLSRNIYGSADENETDEDKKGLDYLPFSVCFTDGSVSYSTKTLVLNYDLFISEYSLGGNFYSDDYFYYGNDIKKIINEGFWAMWSDNSIMFEVYDIDFIRYYTLPIPYANVSALFEYYHYNYYNVLDDNWWANWNYDQLFSGWLKGSLRNFDGYGEGDCYSFAGDYNIDASLITSQKSYADYIISLSDLDMVDGVYLLYACPMANYVDWFDDSGIAYGIHYDSDAIVCVPEDNFPYGWWSEYTNADEGTFNVIYGLLSWLGYVPTPHGAGKFYGWVDSEEYTYFYDYYNNNVFDNICSGITLFPIFKQSNGRNDSVPKPTYQEFFYNYGMYEHYVSYGNETSQVSEQSFDVVDRSIYESFLDDESVVLIPNDKKLVLEEVFKVDNIDN